MPSSDAAAPAPLIARPYQQRIIDHAELRNTLVVLPTGAGKTLIAAELMRRLSPPALFIVPTVLLVKQQARAIAAHTRFAVAQLHGGKSLPARWHVVVATPACLHAAQRAHPALAWPRLRCVVFDEVHHALKKHPYRTLALSLRRHRAQPRPRVLGLTASFTYALAQPRAAAVLAALCRDFEFAAVQTASPLELKRGGYHASSAGTVPSYAPPPPPPPPPPPQPQPQPPTGAADAANVAAADGPPPLPEQQRQPHLMLQTFMQRCESGVATRAAQQLFHIVLAMEEAVVARDAMFDEKLRHIGNMRKWSFDTFRYATRHEQPFVRSLLTALCHWYDALRVLVVTWEEDEFAAVWFLRMMKCNLPEAMQLWPDHCARRMYAFWQRVGAARYERLEALKRVLLAQAALRGGGEDKFRGIVFVEQRVYTHVLEHFIDSDEQLREAFRCGCVYAASTSATPMLSVSRTKAAKCIEAFRTGAINLMIATCVAEEGMDMPAANCVIRFDAVQSTVSFVQGRGRARLRDSSFVVLKESAAKSSARFAQVEGEHKELLASFCEQEHTTRRA